MNQFLLLLVFFGKRLKDRGCSLGDDCSEDDQVQYYGLDLEEGKGSGRGIRESSEISRGVGGIA